MCVFKYHAYIVELEIRPWNVMKLVNKLPWWSLPEQCPWNQSSWSR